MSAENGEAAAHPARVDALSRKAAWLAERVDDLEHRLETTESLVRADAAESVVEEDADDE